jgi:Icc-related predicted phosphoesterase
MIIDCIADLHGYYPKLEGGDLLIVAGDLTARHTEREFYDFANWMRNQNYEDMIVIAGNHDTWLLEADSWDIKNWINTGEFEFLHDDGTELENGMKIWGSPWTLKFSGMNPKCMAFTCDNEKQLSAKWELIPDDIDILVTHGPPYSILDGIPNAYDGTFYHAGSKSLALRIGKMKKSPKLWCWGHIHEAHGQDMTARGNHCKMVNASYVNEHYKPVNKPIRIEL